MQLLTTDLMAAFIPGASPPDVRTPILLILLLFILYSIAIKANIIQLAQLTRVCKEAYLAKNAKLPD
jgi:hypothetical protein